MKPKLSIRNGCAIIFMVGCIVYTVLNYAQLSEGEGWGVVGIIDLTGFATFLLVLDLAIQFIFKNRVTVNIIGNRAE